MVTAVVNVAVPVNAAEDTTYIREVAAPASSTWPSVPWEYSCTLRVFVEPTSTELEWGMVMAAMPLAPDAHAVSPSGDTAAPRMLLDAPIRLSEKRVDAFTTPSGPTRISVRPAVVLLAMLAVPGAAS